MAKQKTSKTIAKRFKITKTGKLLRRRQYAGHLRVKKSRKRIRRYKEPALLNKKQTKIIMSLIKV